MVLIAVGIEHCGRAFEWEIDRESETLYVYAEIG